MKQRGSASSEEARGVRRTSLRRIVPFELIMRLQFSTTSMNSSFLRYLIPSFRQLIAPVAWIVTPLDCGRSAIALRLPSCVMYIFSTSVLQFCG